VLGNDSLAKRAKAIPGYDAFSFKLLIRPLIRNSAISLSSLVASPKDQGRNALREPSLTVSWSFSLTLYVGRRPIGRRVKPSLKNGIVKERRNVWFVNAPVWAPRWNFSLSLRRDNLLPGLVDGRDFFRRENR
jgi:hypothetical protein